MNDKFTLEEVMEAYLECRRNKRRTVNALLFEENWMENCVGLHRELTEGTYKIGRSIAFAVTRPKVREVFAADFRDRIVHHLVMRRLEPLFEAAFIDDNYNCRKGKGTLYGFNRLHNKIKECSEDYTKDCWILKGDMKGFFMSISKSTLWSMLERFIKDSYKGEDIGQILWLTEMIALNSPERNCVVKGDRKLIESLPSDKSLFTCGEDYGLPIGNLTSQMFANFYLSDFDKWMEKGFKYYGRYVDDFYIICTDKRKLLDILPRIRERLKLLHVTLHPDKIYLQHYTKGVKFIGGVSKMGRRYISNRTIDNMLMALKELNDIEEREDHVDDFLSRMNSYLGFLRQYNSYGIRRRLYREFDQRWWEFITVDATKGKDKICLRSFLKTKRRNKLINEI